MSLWHPTKPAYPIADQIQTLGSPTLRWLEIYSQLPLNYYNLGDTILRRDDTVSSTTSTTYVKVKEFYVPKLIPKTSKLRIYFELASYYEGFYAYAKIYRNGSPYGTERLNDSTTYSSFTEDLEFSEGDYIQIYAKCASGGRALVGNFRIQGTLANQLFDAFGRIQSRLDEYAGLLFGGGGATLDVNLYRSAADVLKTDDNFDALALRIGGTEVISNARKLRNIVSIIQSLLPDADNSYDLGSESVRWRYIFPLSIKTRSDSFAYVDFESYDGSEYQVCAMLIDGLFSISRGGNILPYTDNTGYLGNSSQRWAYFYAVNKNAAFKHPLHNPERYIVFKCVESPKVTVEDWGIAELKNGKAFVGFSEEFVALMSDKAEYAVFLTPEGECNGLYVSKKEFYGFEVAELNNGKSNIRFSWHVKAIRIGDEETPVLEEPTPQFTDQERNKQLEWIRQKQEADKKKEEDRLNRMKQKIAKYREVLGET
jgi:hypothetical protein